MRWSGGGPTMVCDGITTSQPQRGPCQCPQPDDPGDEDSVWEAIRERRRLAGLKTPQGCYPYTWINVCLPDIGGFGVWQLLSKSENAAAEIIQQAALLEQARAAGQYLPARLALEYREARVDGMLRQYNVPAIRIDASIRAIANGEFAGRSLADQLPPAPGEQRRAITSGAALAREDRPAIAQDKPPTAQQIADAAAKATTLDELTPLKAQSNEHRLGEDMICPPGSDDRSRNSTPTCSASGRTFPRQVRHEPPVRHLPGSRSGRAARRGTPRPDRRLRPVRRRPAARRGALLGAGRPEGAGRVLVHLPGRDPRGGRHGGAGPAEGMGVTVKRTPLRSVPLAPGPVTFGRRVPFGPRRRR